MRTSHKILVWSYERGTIPYDILCVLILAFVFLVPPSCFSKKRPVASTDRGITGLASDTVTHPEPDRISEETKEKGNP